MLYVGCWTKQKKSLPLNCNIEYYNFYLWSSFALHYTTNINIFCFFHIAHSHYSLRSMSLSFPAYFTIPLLILQVCLVKILLQSVPTVFWPPFKSHLFWCKLQTDTETKREREREQEQLPWGEPDLTGNEGNLMIGRGMKTSMARNSGGWTQSTSESSMNMRLNKIRQAWWWQ